MLCKLHPAHLPMSSSAVGGQMFPSPGDHSLGEVYGHAMGLQEVQLQLSLVTDIGNWQRMVDISFFQVDIKGCFPRTLMGDHRQRAGFPYTVSA